MQCKYCGHLNSDNTNFCSFCGQPLDNNTNVEINETIQSSLANVVTISEPEFRHRRKLSIISIIIYFIGFYIVASLVSSIVVSIFFYVKHIDVSQITDPSEYLRTNHQKAYYNILAGINLFTYLSLIGAVVPIMKRFLITDFRKSLNEKGKFWRNFGIGIALLYGISLASSIFISIVIFALTNAFPIFKEISSTSGNQSSINELLRSGAFPLCVMLFMTVVCAPILEELIFRKAFFNLSRKKGLGIIFLTGAIFGSIHTVSSLIEVILSINSQNFDLSMAKIVVELLNFISYFTSGIMLGFIYYKSNYNIWVTIAVHATYNAIGIIFNLFYMFALL